MNRTPDPTDRVAAPPAVDAGDDAATEAALNAYAEFVESDDFEIPADAVVHAGTGDQPGRAFLEQFVSAEELDRIAGRGRPSLSGKGTSPKRQVSLPHDVNDALDARAAAEGRKPAALIRDAVVQYLGGAGAA